MLCKLIALDLDGTLLDGRKAVSARNARALHRAADRGIRIVISSGRILPEALACVRGLDMLSCVSSCNGAFIRDLATGRTIHGRSIGGTAYVEALALVARFGAFCAVYGEETVYLDRASAAFHALSDRFIAGAAAKCEIVGDLARDTAASTWEKYKLFAMAPDPSALVRLRSAIEGTPGLEATASSPSNVEIMAAGVDKGEALRLIGEYYGVPRDAMAAIGDEENDVPMLAAAGLSFAMGNAVPAVRAAAARVTSSNDEDGVAQAIESVIA